MEKRTGIQEQRNQQCNTRMADGSNVCEFGQPSSCPSGTFEGMVLIDGAWRKTDSKGVAAMAYYQRLDHSFDGLAFQSDFCRVNAPSAEVVETVACLKGLIGAQQRKWSNVTVKTDCLNLVKAIQNPTTAHHAILLFIEDIIYLASSNFNYCKLCKVNRVEVSPAHNIAVFSLNAT